MKTPRFTAVDFEMVTRDAAREGSRIRVSRCRASSPTRRARTSPTGPSRYDDLEPFYVEAERLIGVAGDDSNPFAPPRSAPYPMPAHEDMYIAHILRDGASRTTFLGGPLYAAQVPRRDHLALLPEATARPRAAAVQPVRPVQRLRLPQPRQGLAGGDDAPPGAAHRASCQLRFNCHVTTLRNDGGTRDRRRVRRRQRRPPDRDVADAYVLAATAIESARLCLLSPTPGGGALGNSQRPGRAEPDVPLPDQRERLLPAPRARPARPGGHQRPLRLPRRRARRRGGAGGRHRRSARARTSAASASSARRRGSPSPRTATSTPSSSRCSRYGQPLKNALRDQPLGQHLFGLLMQGEDAPQRTNNVTLDPTVQRRLRPAGAAHHLQEPRLRAGGARASTSR